MTEDQRDRLAWLDHVLGDPDAGRLMTIDRLNQLDEERKSLRELAQQQPENEP